VKLTSVAVNGAGGTKKSALLTAFPAGVDTDKCPDVPPEGTATAMLVPVVELGIDGVILLKLTRSFAGVASKFVPLMVTAVVATPILGVNELIVGTVPPVLTVKVALLVAEPVGLVTASDPLVAPLGTLHTISDVLAASTVAPVPLKVTVF